ncbi:MAG: hypothetical protein OIF36_00360 [Alphaproteobacteria bacterium]|nr:hypothetical protein [Alphaproteobacteria bacterium]
MNFSFKKIIFTFVFALVVSSARADVVNEYRDYTKDGYISSTMIYNNETNSGEKTKQRAIETYGEYNISDNVIGTFRYTTGNVRNIDDSGSLNDSLHIASAGLRFRWPVVKDKLHLGFKTNVVHRDYSEIQGISYRFMPVIEFDPYSFLNMRYIYEFDYIPSGSYKSSETSGGKTDQENALYIRLMPWKYFSNSKNGLEYEVKIASGVGNDKVSGKSKWDLSYEHNLDYKIADKFKLKYSIVREGADWGYQTFGLNYSYNF